MDDHSNVTDFPGRAAHATSASRWQQSSQPSPRAIALLTTCLALVRPVGFTDDNARDWLRVAANEIAYIPLGILTDACSETRRTATHHAQIVPGIIKFAEPMLARRASIEEAAYRPVALPAPPPWQPTPKEIEAIKADVARSLSAAR